MNKTQLLVLFGCIPLRILIAYVSTRIPPEYLYLFGILLFLISLGFLILYFKRIRMNPPESGTGTAWWHDFRLIHGLLYLAASIYAFQKKSILWIPLTIDVIIGSLIFIFHYNFNLN